MSPANPPTYPPQMNLTSLPVELLEHILVTCAHLGDPTSIANLSLTCRFFRDIVYHASDAHLWREIYLTTFDDPRLPLKAIRRPLIEDTEDILFDWKRVYQDRIQARRLFERTRPDQKNPALEVSVTQHWYYLLYNLTWLFFVAYSPTPKL